MKLTTFEQAVLEKAYENGLRFLARVNEKDILLVEKNPKIKAIYDNINKILDNIDSIIEKTECISDFGDFKFANIQDVLPIEKLLGKVDWTKVKKDTLVKVRSANGVEHFRYFCRKIDNVHGIEVYPFGTTSVTAPNGDTEVYYDFELILGKE